MRITAFWAFSESALGGLLHALAIPFRGIIINSAAVLFIPLIAHFSKARSEILKSAVIVIIIKAMASPHSPITAYLAVALQGFAGYILFISKKYFRTSAFLLGVITLFFSGFQKIIVLTVLFGNDLWKSIDIFIKQTANELFGPGFSPAIHFGFLFIGIYVSIHIIAGAIAGLYAGSLPEKLDVFFTNNKTLKLDGYDSEFPDKQKRGKKKNWFLRPSVIIILSTLIFILFYSYLNPYKSEIASVDIIFMLIRSVVLILIWYFLFAPFIKKVFQKYLSGRQSLYSGEINETLKLFPQFRKIAGICWRESQKQKGIKRIRIFLSGTLFNLLMSD